MRIAFVGKGGSGKSTLTAAFTSYLSKHTPKPVVVFDADLNIHTPELLNLSPLPFEKHLSHSESSKIIKGWLIGENHITDLGAFRKTTPPTRRSNIIKIENLANTPLINFAEKRNNISVFVVGTYREDEIGASCYHNNLAILESILNHTDDSEGYVVVDMVAGVDSFAGTLHSQFDLTCLIVEPTKRSVEVYTKYIELATGAGIAENVRVIGNKVRDDKDRNFIKGHIPSEKIIGYFTDDDHIRNIDQDETFLSVERLSAKNQNLLKTISRLVDSLPDNRQVRLEKIWELHKKYADQTHIKKAYGDLSHQIDPYFKFNET